MKWTGVLTIGDLLVRAAELAPDKMAVVLPEEGATYDELLEASLRCARGLHSLGVRRGDHVGILLPNSLDFLHSFFGVALLGAVSVPINTRYRSTELADVVDSARIRTIVTSGYPDAYHDLPEVVARAIPGLTGALDSGDLSLPSFPALRNLIIVGGADREGFVGPGEFARRATETSPASVESARRRVRVRDVATLIHTSGTSARPKACVLTHESLSRGSVERFTLVPGSENRSWCPTPFFHIAAQQVVLGSVGHLATFYSDVHFDPKRGLQTVIEHEVEAIWTWFGTVVQPLTEQSEFSRAYLPHLKSILTVGPPSLLRGIQKELPGVKIVNAAGITEAGGLFAMSSADDPDELRATTNGRLLEGFRARVVDPQTGEELPRGVVGELLVDGYGLMEGYYESPEKTAETLDSEGWLRTFDFFSLTDDDYVTYHGRMKDMLKVGGENVSALEIENFLASHSAVKTVAVISKPDPRLGEVPVAFVSLHDGSVASAQELINYCAGQIASFKVPREVVLIDEVDWPWSATKIDKNALRALLTD